LVLVDAVLEVRVEFVSVCSRHGDSIAVIGDGDWLLLGAVSRLLRLFRQHMTLTQMDGSPATVDGVVPSLMQLKLSLDKDFDILGALAAELKEDLMRRAAPILDVAAGDFDGTFLLATALNPQLILLLDDEQLAWAKTEIESQLRARIRDSEPTMPSRHESTMPSTIPSSIPSVIPSALYPDLIQAANQRRKFLAEKSHSQNGRSRYAEAIVGAFFDELLGMASTAPSIISPLIFWRQYATKSVHLSDLALELLSIPSSTASLERIFAISPDAQFDPVAVLKALDDPGRMERDTMLRFNRTHLPRL